MFTKNRDRLLRGEVAGAFFAAVIAQARAAGLLSDEHFSVDGTLIEAWAGQKSFRPKDERPGPGGDAGGAGDFKGQRRTNDTHESTTDPDARLYRKGNGQEARLCYLGHVVIENRSGLAVGGTLTGATGTAEREAALALADAIPRAGRAWARIGPMTPATSSPTCAREGSPSTSPSTPPSADRPSTGGRPVTSGTR